MTAWIPAILAGAAAGILSGAGVGGGTVLLIYLTAIAGMEQHLAQGINLLYFLSTAITALPCHIKNGFVDKKTAIPAILAGMAAAVCSSMAASALEASVLRRIFGGYLIYVGLRELMRKPASACGPDTPPE